MSKQANPTVIGAFVVGAVVLFAGAFALFGGSQIFATKNTYVAFFDEPTNGLRAGANVLLNGVRIGYVTDIDLVIDEMNFETDTQVTLELLPEDIMTRSGRTVSEAFGEIDHDVLLDEAGLRATLAIESFVTGQLRIELVLRPETEAVMRSIGAEHPEIPTISSNIQELLNKLQSWFTDIQDNVDIGAISVQLETLLAGLNELVRSQDVRGSLSGLNRLINDEEFQQLAASIQNTLTELRTASASANKLFLEADSGVDVIIDDLQPVLRNLNATLVQAEQTLALAKSQLSGDSEQIYQLGATLDELQRAASSVSEFFDYLERNPESLLRGKSQ
jgi:paraquat-inducible protein B